MNVLKRLGRDGLTYWALMGVLVALQLVVGGWPWALALVAIIVAGELAGPVVSRHGVAWARAYNERAMAKLKHRLSGGQPT